MGFHKSLLTGILILLTTLVFSQGKRGYIATDSTIYAGVRIAHARPAARSTEVTVIRSGFRTTYSTQEINEYKTRFGNVHKVIELDQFGFSGNYFAEVLLDEEGLQVYTLVTKGVSRVFIYRRSENEPFQELPTEKKQLISFLRENLTGCENALNDLKFIKHSYESLRAFFEIYRSCGPPLARTKSAVLLGTTASKLPFQYNSYFHNWSTVGIAGENASLGIGVIHPIKHSAISLVSIPQIQSWHGSYAYNGFDNQSYDILINETNLIVPVMVRYTKHGQWFSPYLELGANYRFTLNNDSEYRRYRQTEDEIFTAVFPFSSRVANIQYGGGVGLIIQYKNTVGVQFAINYQTHLLIGKRTQDFVENSIMPSISILF